MIITIDTNELCRELEAAFPDAQNCSIGKHIITLAALKAIASKCDRVPTVELSAEALKFLQNYWTPPEDVNAYLCVFTDMLSPECRGFIEPEFI